MKNGWRRVRSRQPELRDEKMARYRREYDIPDYDIEILTGSKHMADLFEETIAICSKPKEVSNWLMVETMRLLKEKNQEPEDISFSPEHLAALIGLIEDGKINRTIAKEVFEVIFAEDVDPVAYVEEKGLGRVSDDGALREVVENVIRENPTVGRGLSCRQEEGDRFPGWTDDESHAWQGGSSENQQASGRALIN